MKPLRAHDFALHPVYPPPPPPRPSPPPPAAPPRHQAIRPAVARRIAQSVRERIASNAEAIRLSGIRPRNPARPTARELLRARLAVARRQKFAGLFFQAAK